MKFEVQIILSPTDYQLHNCVYVLQFVFRRLVLGTVLGGVATTTIEVIIMVNVKLTQNHVVRAATITAIKRINQLLDWIGWVLAEVVQ